jgi:hypothetical protein
MAESDAGESEIARLRDLAWNGTTCFFLESLTTGMESVRNPRPAANFRLPACRHRKI